jgi:hypothetical protein
MSDDSRATYDGQADDDRTEVLPEHEQDDESTVGGGVMGSGGTAVDRGTGQLGNTDTDVTDPDDPTGATGVVAGTPAGGAVPYVPGFVDNEENEEGEGGGLPGR